MIQNSTPSAPIKLELDLQYDLQNGYDWPTVSLLLRQSRLIQCDKQTDNHTMSYNTALQPYLLVVSCIIRKNWNDTETITMAGEPALFLVYSDGLVGRRLLLCLMPNRD